MKRLLLIAFYYPPMGGGGITRPLKWTKYLSYHGWQTTVLTAKPHHFWFQDEQRLKDIPPDAEIVRTSAWTGIPLLQKRWSCTGARSTGRMNRLRQLARWVLFPDPYVGWLPFALAAGIRICRRQRIHAILATSPPPVTFLAGWLLSKMFHLPLIVDYRDLWTEDLHFFPPTILHRRLHQTVETMILRQAAAAVLINERMKIRIAQAFPAFQHFSVIRSGYDPDDLTAIPKPARDPAQPFRFIHTGNLTLNRPIEGLLIALRDLMRQNALPPVEFHLYGQRDDHNDELVSRYAPLPVVLHDPVSHEQALALQATADALLFIGYDTNEKAECVTTGKIYEYLYWALDYGKPILALTSDCDAADLILKTGTGILAPLRDPEKIKNALLTLFQMPVRSPKKEEAKLFSFSSSARKLVDLLDYFSC